ncbi:hypothetical protein BJI48_01150 [Helicobacter sp. 11S02596-1]|nr:hypothetical protein BJI48_01150 [Helicobacter sp. 11S02596-1]
MTSPAPLISVITIVYNDAKNIAKTLESALSQTYPNIEYIIIDGDSTDGTKAIIQGFFTNKPAHFKHAITTFVSEKDGGIYDAMNKGVKHANGEWCNFMNSGDVFYANTTLEEMMSQYHARNTPGHILYGDTQVIFDPSCSKIMRSGTHHKYHHRFTHQSSLILTSLLRTYPYDTRFKIAGDTAFFTQAYHLGYHFIQLDLVVCVFDLNGVSGSLSWKMFAEDCAIGYKYNKLFPILHAVKYIFYTIPRVVLRNLLPARYKNLARVKLGTKKQ